ncbi:MAG: PilZ domain-containing protein [Pyrinomonadaceae bacterium]
MGIVTDKLMHADHRQTQRSLTSLPCAFGVTPDMPCSGTITNISRKGCFVKTKDIVVKGNTLYINVRLPENRRLQLGGNVVYHLNDIGFGLLFDDVAVEDQLVLDELVEETPQQEE